MNITIPFYGTNFKMGHFTKKKPEITSSSNWASSITFKYKTIEWLWHSLEDKAASILQLDKLLAFKKFSF